MAVHISLRHRNVKSIFGKLLFTIILNVTGNKGVADGERLGIAG